MAEELIIPHNLIGKDVWVPDPNGLDKDDGGYHRKDGGKFTMNDDLSQKDRQYLVDCGVELVLKGGAKVQAKVEKEESKKKESEKETVAEKKS